MAEGEVLPPWIPKYSGKPIIVPKAIIDELKGKTACLLIDTLHD